jgi:hypothetical protein
MNNKQSTEQKLTMNNKQSTKQEEQGKFRCMEGMKDTVVSNF